MWSGMDAKTRRTWEVASTPSTARHRVARRNALGLTRFTEPSDAEGKLLAGTREARGSCRAFLSGHVLDVVPKLRRD